jgi:UTP--glucose-1-phosphate uridylyltransferase
MQDEGNTVATPGRHRPVTAVVPAAGHGTRLRPLSDAVPKEMLPLGRRPVLEHIVLELEAAGIQHIVLVLSPAKMESIRSYFGGRRSTRVEFSYVLQPEMRGLGDAVLRAEAMVGDTFVVALGDAVFEEATPGAVTRRLIDAAAAAGAAVGLAVHQVPRESLSRYGVVRPSVAVTQGATVVPISDIVEKPAAHEAPSDLAAAARYVVTREIFDVLRATPPDPRGEIQLTHALQHLLREGRTGIAVPLQSTERRHDIGAFDSYFRAFLTFALADKELGEGLRRDISVALANGGRQPRRDGSKDTYE